MFLRFSFFIILSLTYYWSYSQIAFKQAFATKTSVAPKIDGILNDTVWNNAIIINDFVQSSPINNVAPSFKTEVKILYNNNAIYVGAFLYDPQPDSIYKELGNRDDDLNADAFYIGFDTYNNQQDTYIFGVSASGVQSEIREMDNTYNAVWQSAVKITENGWCVEMKIPYSAIRFPQKEEQIWGLQLYRNLRRFREEDEWSLHKKGTSTELNYWGKLNGINHIEAPLRLSLTPYISVGLDHYPYNNEGESNYSSSFTGGMDLKYGLNESFTLDMSLLPDFSQVQSDNQVKNLSAFETVFSEQRPFFLEAVDLFSKGDLFYSRRIGRTPLLFYSVEDSLKDGEKIKSNPSQAKLLNATKLSGRNKNGLALGFFNAITGNTYATIEDSLKNRRKVLTDPLTNYNMVVFDQTLKNNSSFYLINTNVIRDNSNFRNSNVTASGFTLYEKTNTYLINGSAAISQLYYKNDTLQNQFITTTGFKYNIATGKAAGNFKWRIFRNVMNNTYNANDLGITRLNNYVSNGAYINYNIYEPFGIFRNLYNNLYYERITNFKTGKLTDNYLNYNMNSTFKNYLSLWFSCYKSFNETYEYYEPARSGLTGRYFMYGKNYGLNGGISSDYRKKVSLDLNLSYSNILRDRSDHYYIGLTPIIRFNSKFTVNYTFAISKSYNNLGYVDYIDSIETIIYGNRDVQTIENTLYTKYMFKNDLFLSLRVRDYWSKGKYGKYYTLLENGYLDLNEAYTTTNDFNFNAFNIDLVFGWQFAPGSSLNIVWKNSVTEEKSIIINDFFDNLNNTVAAPQQNSVSIKLLYYLDYQTIKKKNNNKG